MLLLLYSTGLRLGVALAFTPADVQLENQLLLIRESKFYKNTLCTHWASADTSALDL